MKRGWIISILFLFVIIPIISAGFLDNLFKKDVRQAPQDVSVTVGNAVPEITINYIDSDQDNSVTLSPAATTSVEIDFDVIDTNGYADINDSTVLISFDLDAGGETRTANFANCNAPTNDGLNTKYYTCYVDMEHYDAWGAWTATVSIDDFSGPATGQNTLSFTTEQLKDISLIPATLNFGAVTPGQNDVLSTTPTTITNNGNYNIASNDLNIMGYALYGISGIENIPTSNFLSGDQSLGDICTQGEQLIEATNVPIPNFVLSKGTTSTPLPNRDVEHCMDVPAGISSQIYSTTNPNGITWQITI